MLTVMIIHKTFKARTMTKRLKTWLIHRLGGVTTQGNEKIAWSTYHVGKLAALHGIAHRKARRFEQEFLLRVRDMIDAEIGAQADCNELSADFVAREVRKEIVKR